MSAYDHRMKSGDTFEARCTYTDESDVSINLTTAGLVVTSAIKDAANKTRSLIVTLLNQSTYPGQFNIKAQTTGWAPGPAKCDIQYRDAQDFIISTDTFTVYFDEDITP